MGAFAYPSGGRKAERGCAIRMLPLRLIQAKQIAKPINDYM